MFDRRREDLSRQIVVGIVDALDLEPVLGSFLDLGERFHTSALAQVDGGTD
jgi:hypothetical protein